MPVETARSAPQDARSPSAVALDRFDDLEDRDLGGRPRQSVAPVAPRRRLDQPGAPEIAHHLREEPGGDLHLVGDPPHAQTLTVGTAG